MKNFFRKILGMLFLSFSSLLWADDVVIGVAEGYIPMEFRNMDGALMGFDIDLAREVFKNLGMPIRFQAIKWSEKDKELLEDKNIDVIWSTLSVTEERKKIYALSRPYLEDTTGVLVPFDSDIQTIADLAGKTIATQAGSIQDTLLHEMQERGEVGKIVLSSQISFALGGLLNGTSHAVVYDELPLRYYYGRSPGKFRILEENFGSGKIAVAARPDELMLIRKIDAALNELRDNGTYQEIYAKWFKE